MVLRAGFHGTVGQPSAQVIDGSLKFDGSKSNKLTKTFGSSSNRTSWTWSGWVKKGANGKSDDQCLFGAYNANNDTDWFEFGFGGSNDHSPVDKFYWTTHSTTSGTTAKLRDNSAWYHCLVTYDGSNIKVYINSSLRLTSSKTGNLAINANFLHSIGMGPKSSSPRPFFGSMSQVYLIDGQVLNPSDFGFTDPLTNTWRPKKYTGTFGTNGFYLPMDGNSPIGQDKSGKGNDWTPVNFGGSVALDKATGALPILNTVSGGNYATVGVRTDAFSSNLKLAVDHAGSAIDRTNAINGNTNLMTSFSANNSTYAYPTDASGSPYGEALYINGTGDYPRINFTAGDFNFMHNQDDSGTVEFWFYNGSYSTEGYLFSNVGESSQVGLSLPMGSATTFNCYIQRGVGGGSQNAGTSTLPQNEWSHIAVTKQKVGSNVELKVYVNGVNTASNTSITATDLSNSNSAQTYWQTGSSIGHESSRGFTNAYISDIRIYNTVKYTGDFIPASTNPDILPDTPSGVSGSSKLTKITDGAVSFDGSGDGLSLATSSDFTFGSVDFTIEMFIYPNEASASKILFENDSSGNGNGVILARNSSQQIFFYVNGNGAYTSSQLALNKVWTHVALVRDGTAGTTKIYINGVGDTSNSNDAGTTNDGVFIGSRNSGTGLVFDGFISNLRVIKGTAVYTSNFTPPTSPLTNVTNTKLLCCQETKGGGGAAVSPTQSGFNTSASWSSTAIQNNPDTDRPIQHLFDGTTSNLIAAPSGNNATNRINLGRSITATTSLRFYLNAGGYNNGKVTVFNGGTEVGSVTAESSQASGFYSLDAGSFPLTFTAIQVSRSSDGYGSGMSQIEVDSSILKDPVARFGDASATNFNPFNTNINTVRGQETGYATWNPLKMGTSDVSMSEGNLFWRTTSNGPDRCTYSTIGMDSGKFYWENEIVEATATAVGIANGLANDDGGPALAHNWMYYSATGQVYLDGSASSYGAAYNTNGTIIGVAFDRDNLTLEFYKNGVSQGKLTSISGLTDSETYFAMCGDSGGASQSQVRVNFGQKPFKFPPPDGFQPLNDANTRPVKVIARPDQYVGIMTYLGTTANPRTITPTSSDVYGNINFKPDLVWIKCHDQTEGHALYDTVRGDNYRLNTANANDQNSGDNELQSFIPNGFTCGNNGHINYNGYNYVAWCWKAGGAPTATNTQSSGAMTANSVSVDGVLQSAYTPSGSPTIYPKKMSVGTKQGFSIVQYVGNDTAGAKLPHGLTQAPDVFITKASNYDNREWQMYHKSLGNQQPIRLNTNQVPQAANAAYFNNTSPTADVVTFGNGGDANQGGSTPLTYIMYAWHDVPGLQKFGEYQGNGSADGPYVELGFRPSVVIVKYAAATGSANWFMYDSERGKFNPNDATIMSNDTAVEQNSYDIDFLSNGFKLRYADSAGYTNYSDKYIYLAWAESPFSNLYGGQSNAR